MNTSWLELMVRQLHTTQYTCMDEGLEQIPGSGSSTNSKLFYTVEAPDKELTYLCGVHY